MRLCRDSFLYTYPYYFPSVDRNLFGTGEHLNQTINLQQKWREKEWKRKLLQNIKYIYKYKLGICNV